jgi:hypothetical protein
MTVRNVTVGDSLAALGSCSPQLGGLHTHGHGGAKQGTG